MTSRHRAFWSRSLLTVLGLVGSAAALHGQDCPAALRGAWRGDLPIRPLFELAFTLYERSPGQYEAEVRSAAGLIRLQIN